MLANGLWPGAYSQLSGALYGFLDRSSSLSGTHWALPPAFPLFCLVSAWVTLLSLIFCHLPITYQFSFVWLEIHDINPPSSSAAAAAARS